MEHWWIGWQLCKIKQQELLREAERFRMLRNGSERLGRSRRKAHLSKTRPKLLFSTLLCNLGQRLIDWGTFLKQHQALALPNIKD